MTLGHCRAGIYAGLAKCKVPESRQCWLAEGSCSVFAAVWELTWLQLCVSCLRSLFISPSLFSSHQHRHDSSSAFGMQIDHLGINTGDWLLFATKLPSASLVNADGNLSLLQF